MTLAEFILARIEDDEDVARRAAYPPDGHYPEMILAGQILGPPVTGEWAWYGNCEETHTVRRYDDGGAIVAEIPPDPGGVVARFVTRFDPARVLAECAALRAVVARYEQAERLRQANAEKHAEVSRGGLDNQEQIMALRVHGYELQGRLDGLLYAVTTLATIWSDHEDYRPEEWA